MKNRSVRRLAVAVLVTGVVATSASTAVAATENVSGTSSSTSWLTYATVRTTERTTVSFRPTDLVHQSHGYMYLGLRLMRDDGQKLSNTTEWQQSETKNIITGVAKQTRFKISMCCYSTSGQDKTWGGVLNF